MALRILLSNDDGYFAPGLQAMARMLRTLGEVTVVAPDHNCSGSSSALTFDRPLTITEIEKHVFAVNGTPADCVHLALTGFLDFEPDLVVSGINGGSNLGDDTVYSGTVAAAREGFLAGIDSISLSQTKKGWQHLSDCAELSLTLVKRFLQRPKTGETSFINVNFPVAPAAEIKGFRATRLGRRARAQSLVKEVSPRGLPVYWLGPAGLPADAVEGTDFAAIAAGYASVTPLDVDFTRHDLVESTVQWLQA